MNVVDKRRESRSSFAMLSDGSHRDRRVSTWAVPCKPISEPCDPTTISGNRGPSTDRQTSRMKTTTTSHRLHELHRLSDETYLMPEVAGRTYTDTRRL
jgi:hypothetical protein